VRLYKLGNFEFEDDFLAVPFHLFPYPVPNPGRSD
jgi:hypothetical protein